MPPALSRLAVFAAGLIALTGLLVPAWPAAIDPREPDREQAAGRPLVGTGPEQALRRFGAPARISRQVYQLHCLEQWHYGRPHHLRLTFDCPRGQRPVVIRVSPLAGP